MESYFFFFYIIYMYMSDFSFGKISVKSRKQIVNLKTYDSPQLVEKEQEALLFNNYFYIGSDIKEIEALALYLKDN